MQTASPQSLPGSSGAGAGSSAPSFVPNVIPGGHAGGGGTGAPAPGQGAIPPSAGAGAGDGARQVDTAALQSALQAAQQQLVQQRDAFQQLQTRYESDAQVLGRLRQAFAPQQQQNQPDPYDLQIQEAERELDQILNIAIQSEREGRPMPVTAQIAARMYQQMISDAKEKQRITREMADIRKKLDVATNPAAAIDAQAYAAMDTAIQNALRAVYGTEPNLQPVRQAQFQAIARQISAEIDDLKAKDPDAWELIRRDPRKQQKMVSFFVNRNLPPMARQIMEREQIMQSPMGENELLDAFREASQIENPRERERLKAQIRQELWAMRLGGGGLGNANPGAAARGRARTQTGRPGMSRLYRAG